MNSEKESTAEEFQSEEAKIVEFFESLKNEFNDIQNHDFDNVQDKKQVQSPFKMADREQIIKNFENLNYVYARVDYQINAPNLDVTDEFEITFFTEKEGKILEFPVSQNDYESLIDKSKPPTKNVMKIYETVGKDCVIDASNSFRILSNNFAFIGTALKYDNNMADDIKNITISSIRQKDFDESVFFENMPKSKKTSPFAKKCMPIPFRSYSKKKHSAKILVMKKISASTLTEQELKENKKCLELASERLKEKKLIIEQNLNDDGDINQYFLDKESCIQEHELYRKYIDQTPKYEYKFEDCDAQGDYVCGFLKQNTKGKYELHDWFIISRPFRNFISMLKYPKIFNEKYLKDRKKDNVFKPSPGSDTPMNQQKWMNFEIDKSDALSGNQNVICNTFRKWQLLKRDYLKKMKYDKFWESLKQKIRIKEDYNEIEFISQTCKEMMSREITDPKFDEFYKTIFVKFSESDFKFLVEKYLPIDVDVKNNNLKKEYLKIFKMLHEKVKDWPSSEITEKIESYCKNFNIFLKNDFDMGYELREILKVFFESELELLNEIESKANYFLWPKFKELLVRDKSKRDASLDKIFPKLCIIEKKFGNVVVYVQNYNKDVKTNNDLLEKLRTEKRFNENLIEQFISKNTKTYLKIEGVNEDDFMPGRFVDEIASKFYKHESFKFSELGFPKDKPNDIYRFLRSEKFTIEHAHDIVVLILYIIYNKNIFCNINGVYNYIEYDRNMILYHDSFVHASWDVHDWLLEKMRSNPMITRKHKLKWSDEVILE